MSTKPTPQNNCGTCGHKPDPDGTGYCHMWQMEPEGVCGQHTGRRDEQRREARALARVIHSIFPEAHQ